MVFSVFVVIIVPGHYRNRSMERKHLIADNRRRNFGRGNLVYNIWAQPQLCFIASTVYISCIYVCGLSSFGVSYIYDATTILMFCCAMFMWLYKIKTAYITLRSLVSLPILWPHLDIVRVPLLKVRSRYSQHNAFKCLTTIFACSNPEFSRKVSSIAT